MSNTTTGRRENGRPAGPRVGPRTRWLHAGIAMGVVALAVLIAALSLGERQDAVPVDDIAGDPTISGEPLVSLPPNGTDPAVGEHGPSVDGADFDGNPEAIGGSGAAELVMFLASWCPACQQELPEVVGWMEEGALPEGVELTAVATGLDATRPNWPPDAWFEDEGYTGRVLVDDAEGSVARSYGLSATPFWVALDADGRVVVRHAGMLDPAQLTALAETARGPSG